MIRPVKAEDYEKIAPLWNSVYENDKSTAEELAYMDNAYEPPYLFKRFVFDQGDELVGMTSYEQYEGQYHPQKFAINVLVRADKRAQGIGRELYDFLLEQLKPFDPISFSAALREDDEAANHFAQTRGFVETKRDWESVLDMATFDAAKHTKPLSDPDIRLTSYADWGVTPERDELFYEFVSRVRLDIPTSEPFTDLSYEQFRKFVIDAPDHFAEGVFFALVADKPVGMTDFMRSESTSDLSTGLTAVAREYRGKGLATALKVKALEFAQTYGAKKVFTDNDTTNVEMLAINEKLGFERLPAWISLQKTL